MIFHSDQRIEYAAHEYRDLVESAGMTRSMSRKGNPLGNARVESFFHTMKAELVHHRQFENCIDAVSHIIEYMSSIIECVCTHRWATNPPKNMKRYVRKVSTKTGDLQGRLARLVRHYSAREKEPIPTTANTLPVGGASPAQLLTVRNRNSFA